jgi:uncharacterized damage-inducible protein DinB
MEEEMGDRKSDIRTLITTSHSQSWPILEKLDTADGERILYQEDGYSWSVHNLISHLADAERGMLGQAQRAVAGKMTVPDDFDLDRWNRGAVRKSASKNIPEILDQIQEAYDAGLEFLDSLDEDKLDVEGRHASGDNLTIEGFLRRIALHRLEHAKDVEAILET